MELAQVASDATKTLGVLEALNIPLPQEFPKESFSELCLSLSRLVSGSGKNAGVQLEVARAVLPRIRRVHFFPEDLTEVSEEEDMRLIRGMALDLQIAQLIASVTTALDEYRNQIQAEHDDGVAVEDERQLPEKQSTASLGQASSEIIESANALDKDFEDKGFGTTTPEDTLRRRVQDSANLSRMARAQLQLRPIVSRWYKATWKAIQKLPKLIEQAGRGINIAVDVGAPLANWFAQEAAGKIKSLVKSVKGFGDALEETGKALGKHVSAEKTKATRQRDPAVVDAEQQVRQMLIDGVTPPKALAELVEILDISGSSDEKRTFLKPQDFNLLTNVSELVLWHTNIIPKHVEGLAKLHSLRINANAAIDLSPLGKLPSLTSLSVYANTTTDLKPLAKLTSLTSLSVQAHKATDITPLGNLTSLKSLSVLANRASDLTPLDKLTSLTSLSVHSNSASDLSPLGNLTSLTSLSVVVRNTTDLTPLDKLTRLTSLSVHSNSASDLSPLGNLTSLTNLSVVANKATDLTPLGNLINLSSLNVHVNSASDFSSIRGLKALTKLHIDATHLPIAQISPLPQLAYLGIKAHSVSGLFALGQSPALEEIMLAGMTSAIDLRPLEACEGLRKIKLREVEVSNYGRLKPLVDA